MKDEALTDADRVALELAQELRPVESRWDNAEDDLVLTERDGKPVESSNGADDH